MPRLHGRSGRPQRRSFRIASKFMALQEWFTSAGRDAVHNAIPSLHSLRLHCRQWHLHLLQRQEVHAYHSRPSLSTRRFERGGRRKTCLLLRRQEIDPSDNRRHRQTDRRTSPNKRTWSRQGLRVGLRSGPRLRMEMNSSN